MRPRAEIVAGLRGRLGDILSPVGLDPLLHLTVSHSDDQLNHEIHLVLVEGRAQVLSLSLPGFIGLGMED